MEYDEYPDVLLDSDALAKEGIPDLMLGKEEEGDDAVDNIFYHEYFGVTPASFLLVWWNGCAILYISMNILGLVHHADWILGIVIIWGAGNAIVRWILQSANN